MAALDLKKSIDTARDVLSLIATSTATTLDDELVKILTAVSESPKLLAYVEEKFRQRKDGVLSIEAGPPEVLVQELGERRIDWSKLAALLPVILDLISRFSG